MTQIIFGSDTSQGRIQILDITIFYYIIYFSNVAKTAMEDSSTS